MLSGTPSFSPLLDPAGFLCFCLRLARGRRATTLVRTDSDQLAEDDIVDPYYSVAGGDKITTPLARCRAAQPAPGLHSRRHAPEQRPAVERRAGQLAPARSERLLTAHGNPSRRRPCCTSRV